MVNAPFTPSGNSVVFTAAASAPTPVQAVSNTLGGNQYRVINAGTVLVFMGIGVTAATASNNAVTITSSQAAIPILPGTDEILTFTPNAYFTGIAASGTAVIYITPGDGA
jgi:hypothetical protein